MSTIAAQTGSPKRRLGDLVFANLTRIAALVILLALAGVAIFLTIEGVPAFKAGPDDLICITGSVFLAGELRPALVPD